MVARVGTVAFQGIEAVPVDVQVMVAPGKMGMSIYGLIKLSLHYGLSRGSKPELPQMAG